MGRQERMRMAKVSSQLQVRIPRDLYDRYGFSEQAQWVPAEGGILLRPVKTEGERCADLLEELVREGFEGEELVVRFRMSATSAAVEYSSGEGK